MMGHIPADREWVGSSEAVAAVESAHNKSEAVEKCKFTIGLAKRRSGAEKRRAQQRGRGGGATTDNRIDCKR